jgi:flagellar biosynthesis/type III secretory pathway M-ring protein FliF/YscJ
MRFALQDVLTQIKGIWGRLDGGQRLVVSAVTLATVAGLGAIVWFAGQPSYETVYTATNNDDISRARKALAAAGITYKVGPGRSFLVEREQVDEANMAIAGEGLLGMSNPSIGGGLSLVEDAETKAYRLDAASRQSAASAIMQLDGVMQATVTASRPRSKAAFRDRDAETKASATVVLRLRNGTPWEPVARAASSIASSQLMVPPQNIEVVSAAGNQRFRFDPDRDNNGGSSDFLALQRSICDERTEAAQARLDQLWPGKTSVSVIVELDPSYEVRSEKVLPSEPIVSQETVKKDKTDGPGGKGSDDGRNTTSNEVKDRKYVTEIGERRTGKMMPDVKRMTVAVLYDRSLEQSQGFQKDELVRAVKAIVGWDPERDKPEAFSTLAGDFAPIEPAAEVTSGPGIADVALKWGPTIGQIVGVFVVVLFLRGLFRRTAKPAAAAADADLPVAARQEVPEESLPPEEQQRRMRREIERSIANDPAALAKLLETWLVEQRS